MEGLLQDSCENLGSTLQVPLDTYGYLGQANLPPGTSGSLRIPYGDGGAPTSDFLAATLPGNASDDLDGLDLLAWPAG